MRRILARLGVDSVAALVLITLAGLGFAETAQYPERAAIWPRWMLYALLALSIVLLLQSLLRPPARRDDKAAEEAGPQ
ncbi:hypothetical protein [Elioraea sp.]|jgi:hypothetical protein|uniref:hypothetical protein n=1 Tax=Elioraea sp. TaxID=2185103 RepID=UPI003F712847